MPPDAADKLRLFLHGDSTDKDGTEQAVISTKLTIKSSGKKTKSRGKVGIPANITQTKDRTTWFERDFGERPPTPPMRRARTKNIDYDGESRTRATIGERSPTPPRRRGKASSNDDEDYRQPKKKEVALTYLKQSLRERKPEDEPARLELLAKIRGRIAQMEL